MSVERIIGIDFGTSTSLVKVKSYRDGVPVDGDPTLAHYVEFDGQNMVPTLIRFAGEEEYYGYDTNQTIQDSVLYRNFKLDLQNPDSAVRMQAQELTKKFFCFLHERYGEQSTHFGQFDMERTIVSYPAKWMRGTQKFMVQAAKDAGFHNVTGMDEPTAALYAVMTQESGQLVRQGYLTMGKPAYVLMIDMGAGTTDLALCRYTPGGRNQIIDTWPPADSRILFGGREMDELLSRYLMDYLRQCDINERTIANFEKQSIEACKSWKENSVSKSLQRGKRVDSCSFLSSVLMISDSTQPPFPGIDRTVLESYCKDYIGRYADLIACAMAHARQIDPEFDGAKLSLAVLTGGHSQWYFARDMLCGTLRGYEGGVGVRLLPDQVISLTQPQGTVSSGLVFSVQFSEPEQEQGDGGALSHVLCLWVMSSRTMAGYWEDGSLRMLRNMSGGSNLPPLITEDSQSQVREDTLSRIVEAAEQESGERMKEAVFAMPCSFTMERRTALIRATEGCGLRLLRIVWEMDAAALSYCRNQAPDEAFCCLIYRRDGDRENIAAFEWGAGVLEMLFEVEKKAADGQTEPQVSEVLKSYWLDKTSFRSVIFVGGTGREYQEEVMKQLEQTTGKRPTQIQLGETAHLLGAFVQAGVLTGENLGQNILLLTVVPERLGVRSAAWKKTEWLIEAGTTIPAKKGQAFRITGTQEYGGVYYGNEKLLQLPFEIERCPALSDEEDTDKNTDGLVEITFDIDTNFTIKVTVNFFEDALKFELTPDNMEKIRQAAEKKRLRKGADVSAEVEISLEEAVRGCKRTVWYEVTGPCHTCGETGPVMSERNAEVTIPAGVYDGYLMKTSGLGSAGKEGEPAGDLLVKVHIAPHPFFKVKGDDVWCDVTVSPEQLAAGEVLVSTVSGRILLKLPKGIKSGQVVRIAGKGLGHGKNSAKGDQYVKIIFSK
ncbi:MAG: Hsp70 family protein [Enterocloster asparagiformis]|nr:Hsp70 family protein [Enterocloster asparagiformis]